MNFPLTQSSSLPKYSPHHTTVLNCGKPLHGWILRTLLIFAKCLEWGLLAIYWENCIRFSVKRQSDGGPACCTRNVATRHLRTTSTQFVCIPSLSDKSRSNLSTSWHYWATRLRGLASPRPPASVPSSGNIMSPSSTPRRASFQLSMAGIK